MRKTAYLVLFNLISALGWAYLAYVTFSSLATGLSAAKFWQLHGRSVQLVQSLAALEIVHSVLRVTSSPLVPTLLQVSSRLFPVWVITGLSSAAQGHWSLYLMVGSWTLVEVPRYLYYALNLVTDAVPFPLFWLRYSLFAVLYPSGITGELLQVVNALPQLRQISLVLWYLAATALLLYIPGSPFMYFHMLGQRKGAFAKRKPPAPPRPSEGIEFPVTDKITGERSTTVVNKGAFEAAIKGVNPAEADRIVKEKNWRFKYDRYVIQNVRECLKSPEDAVKIAESGLEYLHNTFEFIRGGKTMSLAEAMRVIKDSFHTGFVKGTKPKPAEFEYVVPYQGKELKGDALLKQLDKWVEVGTIEPEARDGIAWCVKNPAQLDLSDKYFVLLGAGAAMGPLKTLLALGANVIAVDLDREGIWSRLIKETRDSCGSIYFPLKKPQSEIKDDAELFKNAGCNLFTQTPEIANWISSVEKDKPITIGGYAYLDGALHVKVALAMDAIMQSAINQRPKGVSLAFLCTPTDCHVIPKEAYEAAKNNHKKAPLWQKLLESAGVLRKNLLTPIEAKDKETFTIVDGLVKQQGPNYALAKRMQHWRAVVARSKGIPVSSNIAPSTATISVLSNKQFAAAYVGLYIFPPMEVMYQETSNAVMAALMLHDIVDTKSVAHPSYKLRNPFELFSIGGFHGGNWRTAYTFNSLGTPSFVWGMVLVNKPYVAVALASVGAFAASLFQFGAPHNWGFL